MNKSIVFFSMVMSLIFSGCVMHPTFTKEEKQMAEPVQNTSEYGQAFKNLNDMIKQFNKPKYRFQVKKINNLTSSQDILPLDSKSFITTPLILHMKNLRLMAYEPIFNRYETLTTGHVYFPTMKKKLPHLVINGAITQFDKGMFSKSANLDVDLEFGNNDWESDLRADRDRSKSISQIALDLSIFKYKDRTYVPGVATKNKIEIHRIRKKNRLGFFLNGSGIGESKYSTLQQSKDEALRILTEYSLLQLLGRLYQVPYWNCVSPAMEPDPLVIENKSETFIKAKDKVQHALIEQLIPLYGYKNVKIDGKLSAQEQKALLAIAQEYNFSSNKVFSKEFYEEIYRNIPTKDKEKT